MFAENNPSSRNKYRSVSSNRVEQTLPSDDAIRSSTSEGREEGSLNGFKPASKYNESTSMKDRQMIKNRRISETYSSNDWKRDKSLQTHQKAQDNGTIRRYSEKLFDANASASARPKAQDSGTIRRHSENLVDPNAGTSARPKAQDSGTTRRHSENLVVSARPKAQDSGTTRRHSENLVDPNAGASARPKAQDSSATRRYSENLVDANAGATARPNSQDGGTIRRHSENLVDPNASASTRPKAQEIGTVRRHSGELIDPIAVVSTLATPELRQRDARVRASLRQSNSSQSTPSQQPSMDDSRQTQLSDDEIIRRNFGTPGVHSDRPSNLRRSFTMKDSYNRGNHTDIEYEVNPEALPRRTPVGSSLQQAVSPRKSFAVHQKTGDSKNARQPEVSRDGNHEPMIRRTSERCYSQFFAALGIVSNVDSTSLYV
jgi:hypothetical protein